MSSSCSASLHTLAIVYHSGRFLIYTIGSHCGFNCISLIINEIKHVSCLLAIWISSFVKYLFKNLKSLLFSFPLRKIGRYLTFSY